MKIKDFQRVYKTPTKKNSFCYYPFYALVFKLYENEELAAVAPCCMMHDTHQSILTKDELRGLNPEEIFNHPKFLEFRKNILSDIKDVHCKTCWDLEEKGYDSFRLYTGWSFDEPFETQLKELDLSLSNKCNLACRMCNLGGSHRLKKDIDILKTEFGLDKRHHLIKNLSSSSMPKNAKNNIYINWIKNNTDQIKSLKISGGEPLYDKNVINLLEKFVEDGNSEKTTISLHTNAMLLDDNNIKLLNKFGQQMHSFSIDGSDKIYNYIRHNSDFSVVEKNIDNWIKKSNNIKSMNVNFVLSALNVGNIIDFLEWYIYRFYNKIGGNIMFSSVRPYSRGIDTKNLPINYLEKIKKEFLSFSDWLDQVILSTETKYQIYYEKKNILINLENAIANNNYDTGKYKLYEEITLLDKTRNQSYKDYLDFDLTSILDKISYEKKS